MLGVSYRNGNSIINTPNRPFIKDLDSVPFPDRSILKRSLYIQATSPGVTGTSGQIAEILVSRGCPYSCIFCTVGLMGGKQLRLRSVENIMEEIDLLIKDGYKHMHIMSDTFTIYREKTINLTEELSNRKVTWSCETRVDAVDYDILKMMKDAGCTKIAMGVESGSPHVLKRLAKGITIEKIKAAFANAHKVGLYTQAYIIVGNPGETSNDIDSTINLLKEIEPTIAVVTISVPLPKTELANIMSENKMMNNIPWNELTYYEKTPPWRTEHFTSIELMQIRKRVIRSFYFRPKYILNRLKEIKSVNELKYYAKAGLSVIKQFF